MIAISIKNLLLTLEINLDKKPITTVRINTAPKQALQYNRSFNSVTLEFRT